ncbi:MAG: NAD(P)H-dependent oxidoreductase [Pseudomonadota bacterium]
MLLGLCGSLRTNSVNAKLMREAARIYGGPFEEANLRLPLYDGDLEDAEGLPPLVTTLSDQITSAEAVLVVTPEYNQSFSGVLKNALDWVSRTKGGPWRDKPVALLSAAAGRTGGARAQYALRLAMTPFRPRLLMGPEVLIAGAAGAFDAEGRLTGARYIKTLTELMDDLKAAASD